VDLMLGLQSTTMIPSVNDTRKQSTVTCDLRSLPRQYNNSGRTHDIGRRTVSVGVDIMGRVIRQKL